MVFKLQTDDNVKEFINEFKRACELAGGTFQEEIKGTVHDAVCKLANDSKIKVSVNASEHTLHNEPVVEVSVDADVPNFNGHIGSTDVFTPAVCRVEPSKTGHQLIVCSTYSDRPHEYAQETEIFFKYDNIQMVKKTSPLGLRHAPHVYTDIDLDLEE
ncbi:MAG: hypothetical protein GXO43_01270 [Crenarchaeota archaeon]|nr:hypothetical protein [Thermoproteota archaeon]